MPGVEPVAHPTCTALPFAQVMVVPYCTSLEFQPDANPAMALAEVQSRLPGIRCGLLNFNSSRAARMPEGQ